MHQFVGDNSPLVGATSTFMLNVYLGLQCKARACIPTRILPPVLYLLTNLDYG